MTFTDHCEAQGVRPGALLNSTLDANGAIVKSVHNADTYTPDHVRVTLSWPAGMSYVIYDDELPDWALT